MAVSIVSTPRKNVTASSAMARLVRVSTKIEVINYDYQWLVQNFKFSCNRPVGKAIYSPIFSIPNTKVKGCLKLYPGGVSERYKDYVSVYLELKSYEEADLMGQFSLWIPESDVGSGRDSGLVNFSLKEAFGYPDFMMREYLLNSDILPNDELCLICDISVSTGVVKNSKLPDSDDEGVSVESCLVEDLGKLFAEKTHADVTFVVGDQRFEAHKIILMARSKKFEKMFADEPDKSEFEIDDVPAESMNDLLRYAYTGKLNVAGLEIMEFLKIARCYELHSSELVNKCEKKLISQVNIENAAELLEFAYGYFLDRLYDSSLNFMVKHLQEIIHTKGYKNLISSNSVLVGLILNGVADSLSDNSL